MRCRRLRSCHGHHRKSRRYIRSWTRSSMRPHDGYERICVVIVIVDVDHKIFIAVAVVLFDLVAVVHGGRYVANSDIRLRSRNFYLQVLINR